MDNLGKDACVWTILAGMRKPTPLPRPLSKTAFTIEEGRKAGLSDKRMANKTVEKLGRSLRVPAGLELEFSSRVSVYVRVNRHCAASHFTAARLLRLPAPSNEEFAEDPIHVVRPPKYGRVGRKGVVTHRGMVFPDEVTTFRGILLTSRERTWLDLCEYMDLDDLVAIVDHLIRKPRYNLEGRHRPYSTLQRLDDLIKRHPKKRGIRKAREALELARIGADSPQETRLRLAIQRAGLPEPVLNRPIIGDDGMEGPSPDLSYPEYRLSIEYEGDHHSEPRQVDKDVKRGHWVRAAGWEEIRISRSFMADGARKAVSVIRQRLIQRGWDGTAPAA
ncbi:endonuclease domain-containing protein [Crystallibacter crystallopoietes]|uniref:endonuclease domain-containing protein n=1 Tax=Crystallibacter crystallopoietes TaxID=37928 RepID=UPI001ED9AA70|nr:endonuclease domain-containing protein [Arthrobacter crystallopoietes]